MKHKIGLKLALLFRLTLLLSLSSIFFFPIVTTAQSNAPVYSKPLGIAMETYPYPYPVQYLSLEISGQKLRMAYMDVLPTSKSNGRVVVLLHGKNFYGSYWENTIKTLSAAEYRVVVPDQIGFGKSAKPNITYSFDLLAANTLELLDKLKLDKVVIVGHSMGGMLAVRFARNYPQRTEHLVLENPIGLEDYRFKVPFQTVQQLVDSEMKQTAESIRAYRQTYFVKWKPEQYERFVEVAARVMLSGEYPRYALASGLTWQMIYQQPVRHEFGLLQPPTALIIGQLDRTAIGKNLVSKAVAKTLGQYPTLGKAASRDIPSSKLVELENVGHIPHLEASKQFDKELLNFLQ